MNTLPSSAYWSGASPIFQATVVKSRWELEIASGPVNTSMKQPVPYVHFTMPRCVQSWPKSADCWSPTALPMGISAPKCSGSATPNCPLVGTIRGRIASGISKSASSSESHAPVRTFMSIVLEALLTSVTCSRPPVSLKISQLSIVPAASSPAAARAWPSGTCRKIQCSLLAEK